MNEKRVRNSIFHLQAEWKYVEKTKMRWMKRWEFVLDVLDPWSSSYLLSLHDVNEKPYKSEFNSQWKFIEQVLSFEPSTTSEVAKVTHRTDASEWNCQESNGKYSGQSRVSNSIPLYIRKVSIISTIHSQLVLLLNFAFTVCRGFDV